MRIGLTYDLRSEYLAAGFGAEETGEFDRDDTVAFLEGALRDLGHEAVRIGHVRALAAALVAGTRWDLVFNICEGLYGVAREAQVPALLEAYGIACTFSDPLIMALSLDKGRTKAILRQAGIPTADFFVVTSRESLPQEGLVFPLFAKPLAEGTGKGVTPSSIVNTTTELQDVCTRLLQQFQQPVLVESYLPGREFTIGIVGTGERAEVLGTLEILLRPEAEQGAYSYANKERSEELVEYPHVAATDPLVQESERIALAAWRELGCRDAGRVDVRCDAHGKPQFLEVNPLAGLHPTHSDLPMLCTAIGLPYRELIRRIVESAAERVAEARLREAALRRLDRA